MLTQRFSLLFRLKKTKDDKTARPVYMRITVDSHRTELSINRSFDPQRWNQKAGRATGTKEDARTLNAYLDTLQVKVFEIHRAFVAAGSWITVDDIKNKLSGKSNEQPQMLLQIFCEHNQQMLQLIDVKEYAKGTHTHFETTYKHTRSFIQFKYHQPDLPISQVDYLFLQAFEHYLKTRICAHNTAMKYLGDLKKIMLLCVKQNWLQKDPFLGYKMSRREVQKEFLVQAELEAITCKQFSSPRLDLVRNIFLFSCYTGLAYADVKKLKRTEIRIGIDQQKWIFIKRQKSETAAAIPLLPVALSILDKYADHPKCAYTDSALPILCNQKMNEYLKEIADLCSIPKTLTYHTARHTFATTVTLNNHVPIESVSKMLGHKSLKQTQHYAKILNKKVCEDMLQLKEKLQQVG